MDATIVSSIAVSLKAISETLLAIATEAGGLADRAAGVCEPDCSHLLDTVRDHAQACASKAVIAYASESELDLEFGGALDKLAAHARAARLIVNSDAALVSRLDLLCASVRGVMADMERATLVLAHG